MMNLKKFTGLLLAAGFLSAGILAAQEDNDDYISMESEAVPVQEENAGETAGLAYENAATGFSAFILDKAGLLTETEEELLLENMLPMTEWGNAFFCSTTESRGSSAQELAAILYEETFGYGSSGAIFLIDMGRRRLEIHSDGEVYRTITPDYCQSITDNIYRMAGSGDYYSCAESAFAQMSTLLAGGRIRQPMKHASNALLALALALFICYLYMHGKSKTASEKAQPKAGPMFKGNVSGINVITGRLTSRVIQSSSGGGRGYSGGGGGGGGHSGGGGGHSF